MAIGVGNVIKAVAKFRWDGLNDIINQFHFRLDDIGTSTQEELRQGIRLWLETIYVQMAASVADNVSKNVIELFNETLGVPEPAVNWLSSTFGTNDGADCDPKLAPFSFARTGFSRRQGRKYWPPFGSGTQIDGFLNAGNLNMLTDVTTDWISPFTVALGDSVWTPGIRQSGGLGMGTFREFIGGVTRAQISGQDRRKEGFGS